MRYYNDSMNLLEKFFFLRKQSILIVVIHAPIITGGIVMMFIILIARISIRLRLLEFVLGVLFDRGPAVWSSNSPYRK